MSLKESKPLAPPKSEEFTLPEATDGGENTYVPKEPALLVQPAFHEVIDLDSYEPQFCACTLDQHEAL